MTKEQFIKRIKALSWQIGAMVAITGISFIISPEIVSYLGLPYIIVTILGLVLAQITKQLNS